MPRKPMSFEEWSSSAYRESRHTIGDNGPKSYDWKEHSRIRALEEKTKKEAAEKKHADEIDKARRDAGEKAAQELKAFKAKVGGGGQPR